jgi:hypothetical protein
MTDHAAPAPALDPRSARLVIDTEHMTELRAAQAGDISAMVAIEPHDPPRSREIQALVSEQASLIAVRHGEIVGFLARPPRPLLPARLRRPALRRAQLPTQGSRARPHPGRSPQRVDVPGVHLHERIKRAHAGTASQRRMEPSGVLTGLDEGDPEHMFFQDAPRHPDRAYRPESLLCAVRVV